MFLRLLALYRRDPAIATIPWMSQNFCRLDKGSCGGDRFWSLPKKKRATPIFGYRISLNGSGKIRQIGADDPSDEAEKAEGAKRTALLILISP